MPIPSDYWDTEDDSQDERDLGEQIQTDKPDLQDEPD